MTKGGIFHRIYCKFLKMKTQGEMALKIAVVGATGEVGLTITRVLGERNVKPGQ